MTKLYGKEVLYDKRVLLGQEKGGYELQSLMKRDRSCCNIMFNDFLIRDKPGLKKVPSAAQLSESKRKKQPQMPDTSDSSLYDEVVPSILDGEDDEDDYFSVN